MRFQLGIAVNRVTRLPVRKKAASTGLRLLWRMKDHAPGYQPAGTATVVRTLAWQPQTSTGKQKSQANPVASLAIEQEQPAADCYETLFLRIMRIALAPKGRSSSAPASKVVGSGTGDAVAVTSMSKNVDPP
jgi:hypothetical protein